MGNKLGLPNFTKENANIEIQDTDEGVKLNFSGKINMQNPSAIFTPFFNKLHKKIVEAGVKKVNADFTGLVFLNSSGLKSIIRWVMLLANMDEEDQYSIHIVYSNDIGWQETSLTTFKDLVPDLVTDEGI
jgi:hypothetical protein